MAHVLILCMPRSFLLCLPLAVQHLDGAVYEGVFCDPHAPSPPAPSDAGTDAGTDVATPLVDYTFILRMAQRRGADGVRNLNPYHLDIPMKSTQYSSVLPVFDVTLLRFLLPF